MNRFPLISSLALVVANASVLYFVLIGGYSIFSVLILYWIESAIIGLIFIFKILLVGRELTFVQKLAVIVFFCVHFGMFMLGHLILLLSLIPLLVENERVFISEAGSLLAALFIPAAALFLSHMVSFFLNFVGKGEYKRVANPIAFIFAPYSRILLMHATLLLGAAIAIFFGSSLTLLILMVILKTLVDLFAHAAQRK